MGNRGKVYFEQNGKLSCGAYLHWNGGIESIWAFVEEFNRRGYGHEPSYNIARFVQVVGDFFDHNGFGGLSLGVVAPCKLDEKSLSRVEEDTGVFILGWDDNKKKFTIIKWFIYGTFVETEKLEKELESAKNHEYNTGDKTIADMFKMQKIVVDSK